MAKDIRVFGDGACNEGGLLPDECLQAPSGNADWARINHRPEEAAGALRPPALARRCPDTTMAAGCEHAFQLGL